MIDLIEAARSAERIVVPKGDDNRPAIAAFEEVTGIEVPVFEDRNYYVKSQAREFFSVKAADVTKLVQKGYSDIGVTGKDQYLEAEGISVTGTLRYQEIGASMGCLALMSPVEQAAQLRNRLMFGGSRYLEPVATSFPNIVTMLGAMDRWPIIAAEEYAGSLEVMPKLTGCCAVVDFVGEGTTAQRNGLVIVENLMDIPPVLVGLSGDK